MTIEPDKGFTLIEVMIAVAIIAIISAIAYPAYESQSRKGKRADGMVMLEQVAQAEQRYFSHMGTFTAIVTNLSEIKSATSAGGYYSISIAPGTTNNIASSFIATATPLGPQDKDVCQSFTLSNLGIREASIKGEDGSPISDTTTRKMCWGK